MYKSPTVKQIIISPTCIYMQYAVIQAIGSEENSVAFYLESETDSYYFSLAIWNSITKEYPNNCVSVIRHNALCCGEWQMHNYHFEYDLSFMRSWIVILLLYYLYHCNENKI